ncbi:MAG: HlyD family efflux transporter periplasmic adaptor subunit [Planctomycetota bacterium]
MKNWLSKLVVLLVAAGLVAAIVYSFLPQPLPVEMARAAYAELLVTVDEDGKTRIREKYIVSTPLSGRLLRIGMDPGDPVQANSTLLATIEPRDPELLDARAIAQAEARVQAAQAAVGKTAPMLERVRLEQANAESELQRARRARQGAGITQSELETVETRYRQASEELRSARYAEEIAEFELEQARAALIRSRPIASDDGADDDGASVEGGAAPGVATLSATPVSTAAAGWNHTIRSPITGRVLRVFQESSAVVTAGMALLELGDPTDLEIEIDVLSSDAVKIAPGARVILEQWGGPRPLEGRVRLVEPAGFTKVSTLGVEEQRVNVIVDLVDPPARRGALGDGFRVEARIVINRVERALAVPGSALFRSPDDRGDRWTVFRVVDDKAVRTPVRVGSQNGLAAEVIEGLSEGDPVIVNPSDQVADGVAVRPR